MLHFYLAGHQIVDEASIALFATMTVDSAITARASFALAAAEGTAGGLAAATGVGLPAGAIIEVDALRNVVTGTVATIISSAAGAMSANAVDSLSSTTEKMNNLPYYYSGNFRKNLKNYAGDPPDTGLKYDAHHMFPQKFENFFTRVFGNKSNQHHPAYGSWWERSDHRSNAYQYNKDWEAYIEELKGKTPSAEG